MGGRRRWPAWLSRERVLISLVFAGLEWYRREGNADALRECSALASSLITTMEAVVR